MYTKKAQVLGLRPAEILLHPSEKIFLVRIVAVVVPSPASLFDLFATCFIRLAPRLIYLSENSIALATVT